MANILIREDAPELELLLAEVVRRSGHAATPIDGSRRPGLEGDLLLVAPASEGAVELVAELRARRPGLPVVCVGSDPADPEATSIRPTAIVQKPFRIAELRRAVEQALHASVRGYAETATRARPSRFAV